jgi:D-serine deaminase-like pyridoxal phosphate-dependent protein
MRLFDLDTPALIVDLDRLEANIADMTRLVHGGGKRLRPHAKTHKSPDIARMQLRAGAAGLTVAKLGEAEAFADAGVTDLFIANQIVGPQKLERLMALAERAFVSVAIDSPEAAIPLSEAAARRGLRVPVLIEIDTGLGRAGSRSVNETLEIALVASQSPGLELEGIFTHEGQVYRQATPEARAASAHAVGEQLRELCEALGRQGTPATTVSVGSTPAADAMALEAGITEMRPGVYVFNDRMQVQLGADRARCALSVLVTVTSVRSDGRIIIDGGSKTFASDRPFEDGTWGELPDYPQVRFVAASEEHGHLLADGASPLSVGDRVQIVPNHACTCVNMHDTLYACRGEEIEASWPVTARGRIR